VGLEPYPAKKKIVEKPPRNSAGFCRGGQGLSWAVEPRKEERRGHVKHRGLNNAFDGALSESCEKTSLRELSEL
jgi:hypothetical protein